MLGATPHSDKGVIGAGRNRRKRWMVGIQVGENSPEQSMHEQEARGKSQARPCRGRKVTRHK